MKDDFVKIINETYKVIDFFPDSEPLKNKAKERALSILENLTLISDAEGWVSLKKEKAIADLLDNIEILENYLKLGKYQGFIDSMSFLIISKEYNNIKSHIEIPKGLIRESLKIISEAKEPTMIANSKEIASVVQKTESKDLKVLSDVKVEPKNTKNLSGRQGKILEILSNKEKAQVSDIIKEIPKVTKRTIRRDLDDLLKRGQIIRSGEWNQVFYKITKNPN